MSVLETPRIYFRGNISWDPVTTNNYPANYDEDTGWSILDGAVNQVQAFRQSAIDQVTAARSPNWNPQGTYRSSFYDTCVCGYDLGGGLETDDPVMTATGKFTGMLVDTEPYGALSSQLFFDRLEFGVDGGYRILAPRAFRFTDRYINFARNVANPSPIIAGVASVIWQTSFPKDAGLRVDAFDSKALQALNRALEDDDVLGLMVRFDTYRTVYFDDPTLAGNGSPPVKARCKEMQDKLNKGGFQPNPARSKLVGTIGLWRKGEPMHEPGDRALLQYVSTAGAPSPTGTAFARLEGQTLTLDLGNSVPEVDLDCTKMDLGEIQVMAVPAAGDPVQVASIPYAQYDKAAYEATAGLVTLALADAGHAALLADSDIKLVSPTQGDLAVEAPLRAIPDSPNLYLDQGDAAEAAFQLYLRGRPARAVMPVTLYTMSNDGSKILATDRRATDDNGTLRLHVEGGAGTIYAYVACPEGQPAPSNGISDGQVQQYTYMYVRVLPADTELDALPPTWDNVYVNVLMNWNAMAPCMDNWLRLDDRQQVHAYGAVLKRLTDPAAFENYLFMPVTRDMTKGERGLLWRFLDTPLDSGSVTLSAAAPPVRLARGPKFGTLSRSMRGS